MAFFVRKKKIGNYRKSILPFLRVFLKRQLRKSAFIRLTLQELLIQRIDGLCWIYRGRGGETLLYV